MDIRSRPGRGYLAAGCIREAGKQFQAVLDVHGPRAHRADRALATEGSKTASPVEAHAADGQSRRGGGFRPTEGYVTAHLSRTTLGALQQSTSAPNDVGARVRA